jgi:hypothetical protein
MLISFSVLFSLNFQSNIKIKKIIWRVVWTLFRSTVSIGTSVFRQRCVCMTYYSVGI